MSNHKYEYDVALSFAGEERAYVEKVAFILKTNKIKVFYDAFEEAKLWGKNLYEYLDEIYQRKAKYCIIFISKNYAEKLWTTHERKSAQERAFKDNEEYILPVRFDNTDIPGIRSTVGYVDLHNKSPEELCDLIKQKLKDSQSKKKKKPVSVNLKYLETVASQLSPVNSNGSKVVRLYFAADSPPFTHKFGRAIIDQNAIAKRSLFSEGWKGSLDDGRIFWGPYEALPSLGWYTIAFRVRVNENTSKKRIIRIDINSNSMRSANVSKDLSGINFNAPNIYQIFSLNFEYKGAKDIEYRIRKYDSTLEVWVDYIAVIVKDFKSA